MKRLFSIRLALSAVLVAPMAVLAADNASNPMSIEETLTSLGYHHKAASPNTLAITVKMPTSKRTQLMFVSTSLNKANTREVYSFAGMLHEPISLDNIEGLLEHTLEMPIGSWGLHKESNQFRLVLLAQIPGSATPATIKATINSIAQDADGVELGMTGKDDE